MDPARHRQVLVTLGRTTGVFALSRLVVAAVLGAVLVVNQGLATHHFTGPWPPPPRASLFLQALGSWDGSWYLLIAKYGYFPSAAHAAVAAGLGHRLLSGLAVAAPGGVGADRGHPRRGRRGHGLRLRCRRRRWRSGTWCAISATSAVADRAVVLWVFFPGAVVLSMVYSEALAILLCAVCLLALLRSGG